MHPWCKEKIADWQEIQAKPRLKIDNWGLIAARDEIAVEQRFSGTFPLKSCLPHITGTARLEMIWDGQVWRPVPKLETHEAR